MKIMIKELVEAADVVQNNNDRLRRATISLRLCLEETDIPSELSYKFTYKTKLGLHYLGWYR